jgi:glyoxylase-like metal-dependent hydrolase (beta-lactamase superfamily II)/rhodanese-related sulfurtransferase
VLFHQFVDRDLGCASYLVGDHDAGTAVLVDPGYAIEQYVEAADREGVTIARVLETHTHADHVSGHGRLALERGVAVSIHPLAEPAYPHDPIDDGDEVRVGCTTIRVIHTPGHRPEHCAFLVDDELVLTGDSLFVGDAARPDLAVAAREGAEGLFHSLHRLAELGDDLVVYPGHVAGSLCGSAMSSEPSSTIGAERRTNHALLIPELSAFVAESATLTTPRPPNLQRIVELNRGPFLGAPEALRTVRYDAGLTVLDVRAAAQHLAGHVRGALSVPVDGGSFATKAAFVLCADDRIAIQASSADEAGRAARGLRSVGFLDLAGALEHAPVEEHVEPVPVDDLGELLASGEVDVIDVREASERDGGYIPGTRHAPYRVLRRTAEDVSDGRPVVTICESGARAVIAASVLRAAGVDARPVVDGGIGDWHGETVAFRRCGT